MAEFVSTIRVQHFKSLANVRLDLSSVTILVGENGTGKSNVIDSFRFLRDIVQNGLGHAIDQRGGVALVRQHSYTRPYHVSLGMDVIDRKTKLKIASYDLRFSGSGKSNLRVESEEANWAASSRELDSPEEAKYSKSKHHRYRRGNEGRVFVDGKRLQQEIPDNEVLLSRRVYLRPAPAPYTLTRVLSGMKFASVYPNMMREPRRLETGYFLHEDCSNWGSIIRRMRKARIGKESLERVLDLMRIALPELKQISVRNVGGYVIPQFLISSPTKEKDHYLDPIQVSDGTLRLLGMLLHLYQYPRPRLLALEEPEQTIHPGLLGVLVDAITEVSQTTQVIISTHSPYVLDLFPVEDIRVVYKDEEVSKISKVKESQIAAVKKGLMSVSEIMALDGLRPEQT